MPNRAVASVELRPLRVFYSEIVEEEECKFVILVEKFRGERQYHDKFEMKVRVEYLCPQRAKPREMKKPGVTSCHTMLS